MTATVEGDMDMAGILGIEPDVRNGFSAIRISFQIDADASSEEIAALVAQSQEAFGRLRHHHEPHQRPRFGRLDQWRQPRRQKI